ncbi:transposase [Salmonella enterica]|nr:transposase [Salmonella enterica]
MLPRPETDQARPGEQSYFSAKTWLDTLPEQPSGHGHCKKCTVSQSCGKWYISIQTESEVSTPVHSSASMVGLDVGVAKLATLSDGTVFEPVNSFQKNQKKLAVLQRQLSRRVKFSNNWQKQKHKIQ